MNIQKEKWEAFIERKPGYNLWQLYFFRPRADGKVDVLQPTKFDFKTIKETEEIPQPSFEFSHYVHGDIKDIVWAIIDMAVNQCPNMKEELTERFAVKVNTDEIRALKDHIENLNKIIKFNTKEILKER